MNSCRHFRVNGEEEEGGTESEPRSRKRGITDDATTDGLFLTSTSQACQSLSYKSNRTGTVSLIRHYENRGKIHRKKHFVPNVLHCGRKFF